VRGISLEDAEHVVDGVFSPLNQVLQDLMG
jgi:hypothetical protein